MSEAPTVSDPIDHFIDEVLAKSPFAGPLGLVVEAREPDRVVLRLPFSPKLPTVASIVHGGAIATLVDVAGMAACASGADPARFLGGATINLSVTYIAMANGLDLRAEAMVIQRGATQTVSDVFVRDANDKLVAKGMVISRIFVKGR